MIPSPQTLGLCIIQQKEGVCLFWGVVSYFIMEANCRKLDTGAVLGLWKTSMHPPSHLVLGFCFPFLLLLLLFPGKVFIVQMSSFVSILLTLMRGKPPSSAGEE